MVKGSKVQAIMWPRVQDALQLSSANIINLTNNLHFVFITWAGLINRFYVKRQ